MAAFDFPASPTNGQTYSLNGVTYTYSTADGAWIGGPLTDTGLFQGKDANLTALASLADAAAGYTILDGAGGASVKLAATAAEYRAGAADKVLENDEVWAAAAAVVVSPGAGTVALDMSTGINFSISGIAVPFTLANPTVNPPAGRSGAIVLVPTGDQTLAFGSAFLFPNGAKPTTLTNAKATAIYYYYSSVLSAFLCGAGEAYA